MRVVVPHAGELHPKTASALARYAPDAQRVDVSQATTDYHDLLCELFDEGRSVLVVEHDVEIHRAVVPTMRSCSAWCLYPFQKALPGPHSAWLPGERRFGPGIPLLERSLGCTRFGSYLIAREPDLMKAALDAPVPWEDGVAGHWKRLDDAIGHTLAVRGYHPHVHHPEVRHHHWLPRFDRCSCGDEACARP